MLIIQIPTFKGNPIYSSSNEVDEFRQKYLLMLQLKFVPFVKNLEFVYWKSGGSKFNFYSSNSEGRNYIQHAVIETFNQLQTSEVLKKFDDVHTESQKSYFTGISTPLEIKIDGSSYAEWK